MWEGGESGWVENLGGGGGESGREENLGEKRVRRWVENLGEWQVGE